MHQYKKLVCLHLALVVLAFGIGCSEKKSTTENDFVEDIVGEPIIEITESFTSDKNHSAVYSSTDSNDTNEERIIKEGLVVKGQPQITDENNSAEAVVSNLPPLEEGSEYQPLAFRDMMNFDYLVEWEKDGQEFDFSAYAQRVPKRLRDKSGSLVAIEGFMIPTVVDENNEVKEFLLLPDQMSCCFGQTPEANGWVVINATNGVEVMMDRIIRVTGQLTVEERWDEEFFVGLYHMTCDEITGPAL
tara:strand:+ start:9535 stop:10269 length:735 start_codon:yes stop_codon:yes gene_type:complete